MGEYHIINAQECLSNPYPGISVVPDRCRITIDRRLLVGETEISVLEPLSTMLAELARNDSQFRARCELRLDDITRLDGATERIANFSPAWRVDERLPAVRNALAALADAGLPSELGTYSFCTNGSWSAGRAGILTLGYGPSEERMAHVPDEFIEIDQLLGASKGYLAIIDTLLR